MTNQRDPYEIEIGYLCARGHYLFYADSEETASCGSKSVARIVLRFEVEDDPDEAELLGSRLADVKAEADDHLREVIDTWRAAP